MEEPETQKLSGEGVRTGTRRDRWTGGKREKEGRNERTGGQRETETETPEKRQEA